MILGILMTGRCNAACNHCSSSCGPRVTTAISAEEIFQLMDEAAEMSKGGLLRFCLSGGEPFLDFDHLLKVIAYGHALGGEVTCVSNGYWATSLDAATAKLQATKDAGLNHLAISTSRFHQQFIKLKRVERVFQAAKQVGMSCALKYVRAKSDQQSEEQVKDWATNLGVEDVEDFPVLPYLREGGSLAEDEYIREQGLPTDRCPSALITVAESGKVLMCCTPSNESDFLSIGKLGETSLRQIESNFLLGGKQQILREHGPIHFAREAQRQGLGHRLRDHYAGVCDLCSHICSDPQLAAVAEAMAQEHEVQQLRQFITPLINSGTSAPVGASVLCKEESHDS